MRVERHLELVKILAAVGGPLGCVEDVHLTTREPITVILLESGTKLSVHLLVDVGVAHVVDVQEVVVLPHVSPRLDVVGGSRGIVAPLRILRHLMGRIYPESI
ncbi:MAG: hypothetical protein QGD89_04475 [Actinomycetota bacterium]|nr:hypothetical protein [Actinomycetota bacterium]